LAGVTKPVACQVRSKTGNPCPRRAEVEILGVAFCGPCAREQEAYFAIGELMDEESRDFCGESVTEVLERTRVERAGRTALSVDADTVDLAQMRKEIVRGLSTR
jgi:hypothetical protein